MVIITLLALLSFTFAQAEDLYLSLPPLRPTMDDQYICHGFYMGNQTLFVSGFQPKADTTHSHHMMIFSCFEPGSTRDSWTCNEMYKPDTFPVCKSGMKIIYAWAMNASGLKFPKDVSVMVGKGSGRPYLVIQNHYKNADYFKKPGSKPDQSGVLLTVSETPTPKLAGIYLLVTDGKIPAHSTVYMDAVCSYTGKVNLHPFAFRTHTHSLGKLVTGIVFQNNHWLEIGKKSPQVEQLFYPVEKDIIIHPGDKLGSRCIMENKGDKDVKIGSTRKDEMCNFYIYYWVPVEDSYQIYDENNQMCFIDGVLDSKFKDSLGNIDIPDWTAIMPNETKVIREEFANMEKLMKVEQNRMEKEIQQNQYQIEKEFQNTFGESNDKDNNLYDDTLRDNFLENEDFI